MMAFSVQQTQRKLQTLGIVGIIAAAALSLVTVAPVLVGGGPGPSVSAYLVNFTLVDASGQGASGSAPFLQTTDVNIPVDHANLTAVSFNVSYVDNSVSPLFNPAVTVTVQGPAGAGGTSGPVQPGATATFQVAVNNMVPENQSVDAASADEALQKALGDSGNTTLGMGDWTVSLDVGAPLGGRIRPSGTITYTITLDFTYFDAVAEKA